MENMFKRFTSHIKCNSKEMQYSEISSPVRMETIKSTQSKCCLGCGEKCTSQIFGGTTNQCSHSEKESGIFSKTQVEKSYDPPNQLLGICQKVVK